MADTDAKTESLELNELPNTCHSDLIKNVSNTLDREGLGTAGARAGSVWKPMDTNPSLWSFPSPWQPHRFKAGARLLVKKHSKKGKATMIDDGLDSKDVGDLFQPK